MRKLILSLSFFFTSILVFSQVDKTVVVEHFTNTRCGTCASKNPGFFANLANHPNILHLAIHPSSPYSNCELHLHNPGENDGRTNYYGVYGGTPRLVIQGEPQSFSINFNSPAIFDPYEGQTTPFSMKIKEYRIGADSVRAEVIVKTESNHSQTTANLFLSYAEDTVFYAAPNGENQHYNVFRMAFTQVAGNQVDLPGVGDSIVLSYTIATRGEWNASRMKVIGVLQDSESKMVLQSGETSEVEVLSSIFSFNREPIQGINIFPNPATSVITARDITGTIEVYSADGRMILQHETDKIKKDIQLEISHLDSGTYFVRNNGGVSIMIKK